jgi:hypothetical protein
MKKFTNIINIEKKNILSTQKILLNPTKDSNNLFPFVSLELKGQMRLRESLQEIK